MNTENNDSNNIVISHKNTEIKATILYKNRKNISIKIDPFGSIIVTSPPKVTKKMLKSILTEKGDWILKKIDESNGRKDLYSQREFVTGDKFLYLGNEYDLNISQTQQINTRKSICKIEIDKYNIQIHTNDRSKEFIKKSLKDWYKKESERIILERIQFLKTHSEIMRQLTPNNIKVKEQKSRWATCTSQKNIYINSKISMAKLEVIDYIIIHEFSHLVHMNHSKKFYNLVENIMPDYKQKEKWLKDNGYKIMI